MATSALVTGATVIATMALGGVLAVVIVLKFGKTARTDGLLAAYGVYGLILSLAQSLRATVVARLVEGPSLFANLDRFLAGALLMAAAAAVPLIALGGPMADLLTGELPPEARDTAHFALALFWVAAASHLVAALAAAALGATGEFAVPGMAYVAGGTFAIACVFVLEGPLGIDAVAVGVAIGSFVTAAIMAWRLWLAGYRTRVSALRPGRDSLGTLRVMLVASVGYMISQLTYVISLGFAARIEPGAVTLYAYSFLAATLVIGASSGTAGFVLAAPLSRTWDRRPESLRPDLLNVTRAGLLVVLPLIGAAAIVGDELVELVLGSALGEGDPVTIAWGFVVLGGMMAASVAMPVPLLAAFAAGRYTALAWVSLAAAGIHVAVSAFALEIGTVEAIAGAASLTAVVVLVLMLAVTYRRGLGAPLGLIWGELARLAGLCAVPFVPAALLGGALGGGAADLVAIALALLGYALLVRCLQPDTWAIGGRLVQPLSARVARR